MKINSNDSTVTEKQGLVNMAYNDLSQIREIIRQMNELKPYIPAEKHWIMELKIDKCNKTIRQLQDIIHSLTDIQPTIRQM